MTALCFSSAALSGAPAPAPVLCHALPPGQALTLAPRAAGHIVVRQGALWLTQPGSDAAGDVFVHAGEHWPLRAGQRAVIEPLAQHGPPVRWEWHWAPSASAGAASSAGIDALWPSILSRARRLLPAAGRLRAG